MASCDPFWSSAYAEDLRWRMIWQSKALGLSYGKIVLHRTSTWTNLLLAETCNFPHYRKCDKEGLSKGKCFSKTYTPNSAVYLTANYGKGMCTHICTRSQDNYGPCFWRIYHLLALHERGFINFWCICFTPPEMLDETGADRIYWEGNSMRGKPVVNHSLLVRGKCLSAVAVISVSGLIIGYLCCCGIYQHWLT